MEQILQPGETVKFDDKKELDNGGKTGIGISDTGKRLLFGKDTIASLKEKQKTEKAANKKLPKDYKPDDHGYN